MVHYVVDAMVSWQVFVSLAYETANDKGAKFTGIDDGADFVTQLSPLWQQDKQRLKQMTKQQAKSYLSDKVEA